MNSPLNKNILVFEMKIRFFICSKWKQVLTGKLLLFTRRLCVSYTVMSNILWPHGLYPPGSSVHACSMEEYWSGQSFLSPGDLPSPGIESVSPTLQADFLPSEPSEEPQTTLILYYNHQSITVVLLWFSFL